MRKKLQTEESFFEKVYDVVRQIPVGKVTSYGAIAKSIGSPQSSRMVGWAMNGSHTIIPYVPAHRVVNRIGMLTGKSHFGGLETMKELLSAEGVSVIDDQVVNFKAHFWHPMSEM